MRILVLIQQRDQRHQIRRLEHIQILPGFVTTPRVSLGDDVSEDCFQACVFEYSTRIKTELVNNLLKSPIPSNIAVIHVECFRNTCGFLAGELLMIKIGVAILPAGGHILSLSQFPLIYVREYCHLRTHPSNWTFHNKI